MTPEEKKEQQLSNLKPFEKGDARINRKGRKPGVKNWGKVVQDLLGDEELLRKMVGDKNLPAYADTLPNKNAANIIVAVMVTKAIQGDIKAANWLRRLGYGDKLLHEFDDGFFEKSKLLIEIVEPKHAQELDESTES